MQNVIQRLSLLAASSLALSACAVLGGPDLDRTVVPEAPDAWMVRSDLPPSPLGNGWVDEFADTGLSEAVREAFANNRNLQSVLANLQAARAAMRIARADLFPRVDLSATANDTENAATAYTGALTASWETDIWGRNLALARAGKADARVAAADYAGARLALAASVTRAWHDLGAARLTLDLAERDLVARNDTLRITDARFRAGLASGLDKRLATVAVANSQDRLEAAKRTRANAARTLEILLGRYPSSEERGANALPMPDALPGVTAPAAVLAGRPDLVAAEARVDAAGLRAVDARHALLPRITLNFNANAASTRFGDIFDPGTYLTAIAGSLLQPLFRGGALIAEADRRGELARGALFDYAQTALEAYQEVENALDAETTLGNQVEATATAAEEARVAVNLTRRRYLNGRATIFDLLNAQTTAIAAETRAVEARRARIENRILLHLALGDEPLSDEVGRAS